MNTVTKEKLEELLSQANGDEITPEHRAWMNEQIRATLAKVEAGEIEFHSLEDVMRKFGFDAR